MTLTLSKLLRSGYFPRELPPPFRTRQYATFAASRPTPFPHSPMQISRPEIFNLARTGTLRRPLSILNPVQFYRLASYVVDKWPALRTHANASPFSLTRPIVGRDSRALGRRFGFDVLAEKRARLRSRSKFILRTDISRFYPSLYTHCIAWATEGKVWCKIPANRNSACLGNDLDKLVQKCQDGQTNGIPIGPDTSLLIAEMILSKVDTSPLLHGLSGLRYIDDYEFVFDSEAAAFEGLTRLQQSLFEYELHLNAAKTAIVPLPQVLQDSWATELKSLPLDSSGNSFKGQLIRFFDTAFSLADRNPADGVLRYAVGRIANLQIHASEDLVDDLLTQSARIEAGALPIVLRTFLSQLRKLTNRKRRRGELLLKTIREHAPQRHGSEVAWSLWGCIALRVTLPEDVAKSVVAMEDSVCALLALHARSLGLTAPTCDFSGLGAAMTTAELYDTRWMLAYEANVKGWLAGAVDNVASDQNFAAMRTAGVAFYDVSRTRFPRRRSTFRQPATSSEVAAEVEEDVIGLAYFSGR